MKPTTRSASALLAIAVLAALGAEPWTTYRGNPQRTGCVDGQAGPAAAKVLWHWEASVAAGEGAAPAAKVWLHFVASPVPDGERLFISGLGGFNSPVFLCLDTAPAAAKRVVWKKTIPAIKLPTVSSPAIVGDRLVFGDGMHQTSGATLHCVRAEKGQPVWQLPVPGDLVHLEGSPTVVNGKAYLGGGAAGVLCVDVNRVMLEGKEMAPEEIQKILDAKWKALQDRYTEDKKKDPFAVPPTEDLLPRPTPLRLWQQGQEKWHVDAPVAVVGERVLVASAYLDMEKVGDRALFCLDAGTGKVLWRAPLPENPWGGPSLAGDVAIVTGSSVGYDPKSLKGAKGFVAAVGLEDGKERWRKPVTAGIVSCAALNKEVAIVTATDGKVRAFDLASGERRWIYDGKAPFFAPLALAGDTVYAADLRGVVHAIDTGSGSGRWTLDLGAAPVKAPGMVYGGPVVQGGRLYVATCNLEGPVRGPTAVVCIGEK
jgi:outer membrane protein assembly factor BamB